MSPLHRSDTEEQTRSRDDAGDGRRAVVDTEPVTVPPRQCGRCRGRFPGDPTLNPGTLQDWWLCPDCSVALLGDRPRRLLPGKGQNTSGGPDRAD